MEEVCIVHRSEIVKALSNGDLSLYVQKIQWSKAKLLHPVYNQVTGTNIWEVFSKSRARSSCATNP